MSEARDPLEGLDPALGALLGRLPRPAPRTPDELARTRARVVAAAGSSAAPAAALAAKAGAFAATALLVAAVALVAAAVFFATGRSAPRRSATSVAAVRSEARPVAPARPAPPVSAAPAPPPPAAAPPSAPSRRPRAAGRAAPPRTAPPSATHAAATEAVPAPAPTDEDLVERARALVRRDPRAAFAMVGEFRRAYPGSALAEEAEVIAIDALVRLGRADEARARAVRFLAASPGSLHAPRVDRLLRAATPAR